jgi:hypothetical protein
MVRHIARDAFKRLLKGLKAIIPLSPRGLLLCVLSIAILSIGTARVDLAALFWGSSFLLVSLYAILASHLTRLLLRRRRDIVPGFLSVSLPGTGLSPGDQGEARISVDVPPLPGIPEGSTPSPRGSLRAGIRLPSSSGLSRGAPTKARRLHSRSGTCLDSHPMRSKSRSRNP